MTKEERIESLNTSLLSHAKNDSTKPKQQITLKVPLKSKGRIQVTRPTRTKEES